MSSATITGAFQAARRQTPSLRDRARLYGAERAWSERTRAGAWSRSESVAQALAAADKHGVLAPAVSGMVAVGVVDASDAPGVLETGARLATQAARGAADVATRTGAGVERVATKVIEEGARTVRTGPGGETIQTLGGEAGETTRKVAEEAGETGRQLTTAEIVLAVAAIAGGTVLAVKFLSVLGDVLK